MAGGVAPVATVDRLSSPTRRTLAILPSSSPDLPSLHDLSQRLPRKPPLRTGSRAAPIPDDAPSTFTTAAHVWRTTQLDPEPVMPHVPVETAQPPKPTRRRKVAAQDATSTEISKPKRKPKKQIPKTVIELSPDTTVDEMHNPEVPQVGQKTPTRASNTAPIEISSPCSDKPWRRFMASKSPSVGATTPSREETTTDTRDSTSNPALTTSESVSRYFASPTRKSVIRSAETGSPTTCVDDPVVLEPALQRRTDWTPPPEDTIGLPASSPSALVELSTQHTQIARGKGKEVFGALLDTFGYPDEPAPPVAEVASTGSKKRKVLEMIQPPDITPEAVPEAPRPAKPKAVRKKARTITELATAAYLAQPDGGVLATAAEKPKPDSILGYLPVDDGEVSCKPGHPASRPRKGAKGGSRLRKKKGEPTRRNVLLSPESAMRQSKRQDFVFGTSSQLVREDSPTFLRELQRAIQASNSTDTDPSLDNERSVEPTGGKTRLWSAGARGEDGDLLEMEVIDLMDSPAFPIDPMAYAYNSPPKLNAVNPTTECTTTITTTKDTPTIDLLDSPSIPATEKRTGEGSSKLSTLQTAKKVRFTVNGLAGAVSTPSPATAERTARPRSPSPSEMPPPSNQQALDSPLVSPPKKRAAKASASTARPKYELFTDAQLSKEIKNYGFKMVKKRTAMIALLDQCWTSKHGAAVGAAVQSAGISTTATTAAPRAKPSAGSEATSPEAQSPARPRGRPRKDQSQDTVADSPVATVATAEPTKKRGRAKKDTTPTVVSTARISPDKTTVAVATTPKRRKTAAKLVIEIADSDLENPFSSPISTADQVFSSSPPAVDVSATNGEGDTSLLLDTSPTDQQAATFGFITKAVTSAPRTTDPQSPSWHEKMLMYDPIIVEDLAGWLNAGQLDRVGFDGEVSAEEVKRWCESKSVCCLWSMSYQGRERKRL